MFVSIYYLLKRATEAVNVTGTGFSAPDRLFDEAVNPQSPAERYDSPDRHPAIPEIA